MQIEVTAKAIAQASQLKDFSSYCDVALKPKEAWVMDTSETLGSDVSHIAKGISCIIKFIGLLLNFRNNFFCV